ncbi:MarR family winged helix-turn-helix transcriptional regulator [Streptomyces sp. NPDC059740]|uniref:MarR family winged helix-turn-helix transcriptional regulator n=1 Tax=Streptomyces sp. NPDC059740 TaxID=3346926 RepID=UPI00364D1574
MPEPDSEQLAVDLGAAVSQLMRHLRAASAEGELTPSQRSAMARLAGGGPTTTAALARAELVRPQSMRMTLGALEERELVTRSPHPTDGRQVVFSLTEEGREVLESVRRAKRDWLAVAVAEQLTAGERATLAEATALMRRLVTE